MVLHPLRNLWIALPAAKVNFIATLCTAHTRTHTHAQTHTNAS